MALQPLFIRGWKQLSAYFNSEINLMSHKSSEAMADIQKINIHLGLC